MLILNLIYTSVYTNHIDIKILKRKVFSFSESNGFIIVCLRLTIFHDYLDSKSLANYN